MKSNKCDCETYPKRCDYCLRFWRKYKKVFFSD